MSLANRDNAGEGAAAQLGGSVVRLAPSVRYAGPGGDAELRGLYFADAGQHLEHRLFVDHAEPNCRSRVTYKGALQGEDAHTVWIGDVTIRATATGTDTYEANRNLVLTDGTRVDSVPNLEILTGEVVGAGHASTSGRLDDEHLFYLMARGIPFEAARRLVIRGFFGELIARIEAMRVPAATRQTKLRVGPLELDLIERTAKRGDRSIDLLPREFRLLEYMMRRNDRVLTREMLLREVWKYKFVPKTNLVDVHMGRLRRKIDGPYEPPMIRNVRGQGFIFGIEDTQSALEQAR